MEKFYKVSEVTSIIESIRTEQHAEYREIYQQNADTEKDVDKLKAAIEALHFVPVSDEIVAAVKRLQSELAEQEARADDVNAEVGKIEAAQNTLNRFAYAINNLEQHHQTFEAEAKELLDKVRPDGHGVTVAIDTNSIEQTELLMMYDYKSGSEYIADMCSLDDLKRFVVYNWTAGNCIHLELSRIKSTHYQELFNLLARCCTKPRVKFGGKQHPTPENWHCLLEIDNGFNMQYVNRTKLGDIAEVIDYSAKPIVSWEEF